MKISFVIPAYNEENLIAKCLESVQKEIKNNSEINSKIKFEVIVVNNASTDKTREIAAAFQDVIIVDETKKGLVRARQAGYMASSGELIANIDSDTILPSGWLQIVIYEFEKNKNLVALSGPFIYYDLSNIQRFFVQIFYYLGFIIYFINHFILGKGAMLQGGNFILRRDALEKADGFDTSIEFFGEDTDIARRISPFGKVLWTFRLPIYASGRRLLEDGLLKAGYQYAINFLWISVFGKPHTKNYTDIRINN